ncbi:E3 ubiquitin-protein ligase MARCHF8 isoform X1 [Hydra vulgaris]|uniref:E3 ubiquitin-protein ligase MARCHF8 isoform X1 n=1 Tax=Hydra vulgaris TaxID=6087 RepID=UPI0002B4446D|nr:E3 ubiquitin-protein ligase MARCHF8-like isoform X1 [Hydra vulgaris]
MSDGFLWFTQMCNIFKEKKKKFEKHRRVSNSSCRSLTSRVNDICKICHNEQTKNDAFVSPCLCSGSLLYVHQSCIQKWIKMTGAKSCELCQYGFNIESTTIPIRKWKSFELSPNERRKLLCTVSFHIVAVTCMVWSLCVLINHTAEEFKRGNFEWPFWIKLVVSVIGFISIVVFMYVHSKFYVKLFLRLKTYNRAIFITNVSEIEKERFKTHFVEIQDKEVELHKECQINQD